MGKLVVLKLDGDLFQQGFWVTLTISSEGDRESRIGYPSAENINNSYPEIEITGYLPPQPELAAHVQDHWQERYRRIGGAYRITPQEIVYDGSVNDWFQECQESATELRSLLGAWLDSEPFRRIDKILREELNRNEVIRFLIRTDDEYLQKLPWHLWDFFERYPKAEVALSATRVVQSQTLSPATRSATIRILAILGHSQGIDIDADRQLLENLPHAETVFLVEPNHEEIDDQLSEYPWDIIFFAGHSETKAQTGRIYINQTDYLTIDQLSYALRRAVEQGLKLAIFNSCDGLGLARQLEDLHIPQMIVMREMVPDEVAQKFLKYFLKAFAGGKPLYLAAREARERLQGLESKYPCASWLPVIFQNPAEVPPTWKELLKEQEPQPEPPKPVPPTPLPQGPWRGLQKVLLASVAVTGFVMGMRSLGLLQSWELKAFDQMMQLRPAEKPDPRLLIVKITAEDIKKLGGEYPLHDRTVLRLLKKLEEHQPRVIGLDFYRDRPHGEGRADLVKYLQKSDRIIPICVVPSTRVPEGVAPPTGVSEGQLGFSDTVNDPDDISRRHLLAMKPPAASPCSTFYALSFQLAFRYLKAKGNSFHFITKNQWQLGSKVFKKLEDHTGFYHQEVGTQGFQLLLNYRSNQFLKEVADQVTLTSILTNQVKPDFVKDKIILIGVTDPIIKDDFNTPYNQHIRGLFLHAHMVSQLISAVEDKRPLLEFLPFWGDVLWVWAWSLVGGIFTWHFRSSPLGLGFTGGVAIITLYGICFIFLLTKGSLLPLIPSAFALVAISGGLVAYRAFQVQQPQ
jgi:CHASE2 domain-containing sensor protein